MKKIDFKKQTAEDLKKLIKESEKKLQEIAFNTSGTVEKSFKDKRNLRKTIAMAKTYLSAVKQ